MAANLYLVDFCKHRRLTRVDRVIELQAPFSGTQPPVVALTSLGCRPVVSHHSSVNGHVLSRVKHDSGVLTGTLLASADSGVAYNPGESTWVAGVPTEVLTGSATASFPVPLLERNYLVSLAFPPTVLWSQDTLPGTGIAGNPGLPALQRAEFGGDVGILRTCVVANDQDFLVQNNVRALHQHRTYFRIASVGDDTTPLTLLAPATDTTPYRWPGAHSPTTVHQIHALAASLPTFSWDLTFRAWGAHPAKIGHGPTTLTDPTIHGSLDRKYSILPIDDQVYPDFGGSVSGALTVSPLRSGVHLYGSFIDGPGPSTDTIRLLVNGVDVTDNFTPVPLPTPQFSGATFIFPNEEYDSVLILPDINLYQFVVEVSSPRHVGFGFPEPFPAGTLTFGTTNVNGFLYEGTIRFSRNDETP